MNVVVLAKQVPDAEAAIEIKGEGARLEIEQKFATSIFDEFALEEALRIRERHGGRVKVVTLGAGKATEVLRTGIAMGADEALLLDHAAFLDGDGYATALALSRAVAKAPCDIVLCGKQAIDDDRGEVGPMVAQFLGLPHVGGVVKLDLARGKAVAESLTEGGKGGRRGLAARRLHRPERAERAARCADHGRHEGDEGPDTEDDAGGPGPERPGSRPCRVEGAREAVSCAEEEAARQDHRRGAGTRRLPRR